jgi:hypothetical protein
MSQCYDDFSGPRLDPNRWRFLEYPLDNGAVWRCAEPQAQTRVGDGTLAIHCERFTNAHDSHQNIDNCKHLLLSTQPFALPPGGRARFAITMGATSLDATPFDYRDGFASFNVLDFASGMVFDLCATSDRLIAIYERLPLPGVERPFTYVVDAPLSGVTVAAGLPHRYEVVLDAARRMAEWRIDGALAFEAQEILVPTAITLGLGFISLHPLAAGRSRSLHGQGMHATWRDLEIDIAAD